MEYKGKEKRYESSNREKGRGSQIYLKTGDVLYDSSIISQTYPMLFCTTYGKLTI